MKYLLIILILASCYNQRKASTQFNKAATAYPELPAEYCAVNFPAKDSLVKGDSITVTDTLYIEGETLTDTLRFNDTVRITITHNLPSQTITRTIHITDTVYQTDKAALKLSQITNDKLITVNADLIKQRDDFKGKRDWWRIVALISLAVNGLFVYFKFFNKKIPLIKT